MLTLSVVVKLIITKAYLSASSFSTMKRIKSDKRLLLDISMLEKLMYIAIEGPKVDDLDATSSIDYWLSSTLDPQRGRNK